MDGIQEAKKFMSKQKNGLRAGDFIECYDENDMVATMQELSKHNIETDFVYEHFGQKGLWLQVTKIGR